MAATLRPRHPPTCPSIFQSLSFRPPQQSNRQHRPNPDGSWPAHGVGEWRRHDWMVPLLHPRRERREKPMGVRWRWLELVVVCWCRDVVLLVDVLYGIIFLHSYEMLPFPDIFLRGNEEKIIICRCRQHALLAEFCRRCRLTATCWRHSQLSLRPMADSQNQPPLPHQKHNPQQKKQNHDTVVPCYPPPSSLGCCSFLFSNRIFFFKTQESAEILRNPQILKIPAGK
jgi:hypothetical protein